MLTSKLGRVALVIEFAAVCLAFRQGRAYVVWLLPINRR
ncbi:hypothetical protein P20495_2026 [Pseudoalteromonas sp. BSi20495]|nr:hypothetical protein P20495_2026 [Pseudoalteromonas sp. BSi20495]